MSKVRIESFTLSLDGYGAGPEQSLENPLGIGGTELHQWAMPTRIFQRAVLGAEGGTTGIDEDFVARQFREGKARMDDAVEGILVGKRRAETENTKGGGERREKVNAFYTGARPVASPLQAPKGCINA